MDLFTALITLIIYVVYLVIAFLIIYPLWKIKNALEVIASKTDGFGRAKGEGEYGKSKYIE